MSSPFDPGQGLIIVQAHLWGPNGTGTLRLGLDTGATETFVSVARLAFCGYGLSHVEERNPVTTGSGIESAPRVLVERIACLGQERSVFPVLAYTLPPGLGVDGLLGLDFLRGTKLTLDFREGRISLE